jgi:WD40 repeat protein
MLVLAGEPGNVTHLAFSPDARLLAASSDKLGLEMWNVPARRKWGRYTHFSFSNAPATFHPTEPLCFAHSGSSLVVIDTNVETAQLLQPAPVGEWFEQVAVAPADMLCVAHVRVYPTSEMRAYRLRRDAKKPLERVWKAPLERLTSRSPHPLNTGAICVAPDGKTFATLCGERNRYTWTVKPVRVSLRSVTDGKVLRSAKLPAGTVNNIAFAPDSATFVTFRTHIMSVWQTDLASAREVRSDTRQHFTGVAFHPSGRYLAATSNDTTVKLFDTTTWKVARSFTWDIGRLRSVCFSPDGALAAAGSDTGKVIVWDVDV